MCAFRDGWFMMTDWELIRISTHDNIESYVCVCFVVWCIVEIVCYFVLCYLPALKNKSVCVGLLLCAAAYFAKSIYTRRERLSFIYVSLSTQLGPLMFNNGCCSCRHCPRLLCCPRMKVAIA